MNRGVLRRTAAAALAVASTTAIVTAGSGTPALATPDVPNPVPPHVGLSHPVGPTLQPTLQNGRAGTSTKSLASRKSSVVKDRYIVTLKDKKASPAKVKSTAQALTKAHGGTIRQVYGHALSGYSAQLTAAQAKKLATSPDVASVEPVRTMTLDGTQSNPPSWGLDRLDQTTPVLNKSYGYPSTNANSVTAYIVDSGINLTHTDFGGRASSGYDFVDEDTDATDPCIGHGTHVAGTIGGTKYGVAKDVKLVAVRVFACDEDEAPNDRIIKGIDWVTEHAVKPAVVNLSLGQKCVPELQQPDGASEPFFDPNAPCDDGIDPTVDAAVSRSIASGLTYVISAGNQNVKAKYVSPADVPEAITVGATDNLDFRAVFSNHGSGVDVYAPGAGIDSDYIGSDTATAAMSGTSMAAPHVTGAAALVLAQHPDWTPQQVRNAIVQNGVAGAVHDTAPYEYLAPEMNVPNRLLHVGGAAVARSSVGIQAYANSKFVTAESAGKNPLIARSDSVGAWEGFDVVSQAGGFVALKAKANGKYVTADSAGSKPLIARATSVGAWEKFTVVDNADGSISFKANANGKYVSAESKGTKPLIARSTSVGDWEKFNYLAKDPVVAIKANANGKYVTAESGGSKPLIARSTSVGAWEKFNLYDGGDGFFILQAQANGLLVTAESAGKKPLIARSSEVGDWEWFRPLAYTSNGARAFYANANIMFVTAESGGSKPLIANRDSAGAWEMFHFEAI